MRSPASLRRPSQPYCMAHVGLPQSPPGLLLVCLLSNNLKHFIARGRSGGGLRLAGYWEVSSPPARPQI